MSDQTKPTPGPYYYEYGAVVAEAEDGSLLQIARTYPVLNHVSLAQRNANGKLLAASWEMLEALKAVAYESDRETGRDVLVGKLRFQKVLDVLAKLEGGNG